MNIDDILNVAIDFYLKNKNSLGYGEIEIIKDDRESIYYMKHELILKYDNYDFFHRIEKLGEYEYLFSAGDKKIGYIGDRFKNENLTSEIIEIKCLDCFIASFKYLPKDSPILKFINVK